MKKNGKRLTNSEIVAQLSKHTTWKFRQYILQNSHCFYCKNVISYKNMTIDHVIPLFRGGSNTMCNKVLACSRCNHEKDSLTPEDYLEVCKEKNGEPEEPDINAQAFPYFQFGYYYVVYLDNNVSMLMPWRNAQDYADIFGGTVHKHSQAPKWWEFWK